MPVRRDALAVYRKKRDFRRTPEPAGGRRKSARFPIFVIQKHDATRLHYDFRLEVGGVLKSWAVPKGPSLDPRDKRLAVPTEDHPIAYASFEGIIPEGEYGGGPVIVWDRGYYLNVTRRGSRTIPMDEALEKGHVHVWMEGTKIKGGFSLTRMGREKAWLLVKIADTEARRGTDIAKNEPASVITGRTVEQVAAEAR